MIEPTEEEPMGPWIVHLRDFSEMVRRVVVMAKTETHAKERGRSALIRSQVSANPRAISAERLHEDRAVVLDIGLGTNRRPAGIVEMKGS